MIQKEKKKISLERKIVYIVLVLFIVLLLMLQKEIDTVDHQYDEKLFSEVYQEYNSILENLEEYSGQVTATNKTDSSKGKNTSNSGNSQTTEKEIEYNKVAAILEIEKINLFCPIIAETSYENLNVAPTKFYGCAANDIGNFCVVGHNNREGQHFNNLYKLEKGDTLVVTGRARGTLQYEVFAKYVVNPNDLSCTSQLTNGDRIVTLITCTNNGKQRLVIQCKETKE